MSFDIYAACLILKDYDGDTSTVISKVEYTLDRAKELHSPDLLFFNDMVRFNGSSHIDIMKISFISRLSIAVMAFL